MSKNGDSPATKKDLAELEAKLEANFDKKLGERRLNNPEERFLEIEKKLLRGQN
jgi:hypothetical protein